VSLKLQKRLLEEQLQVADTKIGRLSGILEKKTLLRPIPKELLASNGVALSEFRMSPNKVKAVPVVHKHDPYSTEASPMMNGNILDIRQRHGMRTIGKSEVSRRMKIKRDVEMAKLRKEKRVPSVSIPESMLPNRYLRGELPCTIEHGSNGKYLSWACPLENLDYEYYLPLFFDGLQCSDKIISFIARQGVEDLLYASRGHPERIKPIVHLLARPLRNALGKFDIEVLLGTLKAIQQLITCNEGVGEVLMPFGKQFLAPISYFMGRNKNTGDEMDYGQRWNNDIGEEIRKVLELMEEHGGPRALQAIKFSIPLYESCVKRPDAHHHLTES